MHHNHEGFNISQPGIDPIGRMLLNPVHGHIHNPIIRRAPTAEVVLQILRFYRDNPGATAESGAEVMGLASIKNKLCDIVGIGYMECTEAVRPNKHGKKRHPATYKLLEPGERAIRESEELLCNPHAFASKQDYIKYELKPSTQYLRTGSMDAFKLPSLTSEGRVYRAAEH